MKCPNCTSDIGNLNNNLFNCDSCGSVFIIQEHDRRLHSRRTKQGMQKAAELGKIIHRPKRVKTEFIKPWESC